jgi:hypothetical protein
MPRILAEHVGAGRRWEAGSVSGGLQRRQSSQVGWADRRRCWHPQREVITRARALGRGSSGAKVQPLLDESNPRESEARTDPVCSTAVLSDRTSTHNSLVICIDSIVDSTQPPAYPAVRNGQPSPDVLHEYRVQSIDGQSLERMWEIECSPTRLTRTTSRTHSPSAGCPRRLAIAMGASGKLEQTDLRFDAHRRPEPLSDA